MSHSDLHSILAQMNPSNAKSRRFLALRDLMGWVRAPLGSQVDENHIQAKNVRFKFLVQFLLAHQEEANNFLGLLNELTSKGSAVRLFCQTGVSENHGFLSELTDRCVQKFIPHSYEDGDLADIFRTVFTEEQDAEWFEESFSLIAENIFSLAQKSPLELGHLDSDIEESLIVLGSQIAVLGISRPIRRRLPDTSFAESSFVRLNKFINSKDYTNEVLQEISTCNISLTSVRAKIEEKGVSVDLIFMIERLISLLHRTETLILFQKSDSENSRIHLTGHFIGRLIRDELKRKGINDFIKENIQMLAKKIVERAGEKGDHYIAHTKIERRHLFFAASMAGILTAFTTFFKIVITKQEFSIFFEGFFYFFNYAIGFLLMQKWHLALSSKQPAFTASALSRKFESFLQTKDLSDVSLEIRKIAYSQLIATVANLLLVIPLALLIDWLVLLSTKQHILTFSEARNYIDKHNLLSSGTVLYAAFTGVLLWLSSIVGGWIENWIVFRNIPEAIRTNPSLNDFLGKQKAKKISENIAPVLGAASGNLAIAFFLAAPIVVSKITGLPLDIRHVTLATGTITFAVAAIPWNASIWPVLVSMSLSILVMGALNFGVSFYCAIRMASTARGLSTKYLNIILKYSFIKKQNENEQTGL